MWHFGSNRYQLVFGISEWKKLQIKDWGNKKSLHQTLFESYLRGLMVVVNRGFSK